MKIKKIILENVKSFKNRTEINFKGDLNIFIGPNAGGKSNLFEIIQGVFNDLIFEKININKSDSLDKPPYNFQKQSINYNFINNEILDKFYGNENKSQNIIIQLVIDEEDIKNAKKIYENREKIHEFEKQQTGESLITNIIKSINFNDFDKLKNKIIEIKLTDGIINITPSSDKPYSDFFNYFKNLKIFANFLNFYNFISKEKIEFNHNFIYVSPYRYSIEIGLKERINLSQSQAPVFYDQFNFSQKSPFGLWDLVKHRIVENYFLKKNYENAFIKKYLKKFFNIDYQINKFRKLDNSFEIVFYRNQGKKSPKLSSGEKEFLNLIALFFMTQIKNGVVMIDEPELHLHPKWQFSLLEMIKEFSEKLKIQFFLVTHSPYFVTSKSVSNVYRVYSKKGVSKVETPKELNENGKDLFMIVNIFNNTKAFFSEKLILVEGIDDLIIYESLLERLQNEFRNSEIIEIIEVQQKGGIEKNKKFFEKWKIPTYGIVDKDKCIKDKKVFVLKNFEIEDYFKYVINKKDYDIEDALEIAKKIKNKDINIPKELEEIFKKIITD